MTFQTRRKYCFFKENNINEVDYKDVRLLKKFVNDHGKIMPRRVTGTSAKMHRKVVSAIKRARTIGLMPFVSNGSE
jgi:small subunit ribosomal protein S18